MELVRTVRKIRCEMGACKNFADFSIKMSRVGIGSQIHVCSACLKELGGLIKKNTAKENTAKENKKHAPLNVTEISKSEASVGEMSKGMAEISINALNVTEISSVASAIVE